MFSLSTLIGSPGSGVAGVQCNYLISAIILSGQDLRVHMSETEETGGQGGTAPARDEARREGARAAEFFTRTALRVGLALVGFVLLLFALDQAFGLELMTMVSEFLSSSTGQWLMVAFAALLLILIAVGGWRSYGHRPA